MSWFVASASARPLDTIGSAAVSPPVPVEAVDAAVPSQLIRASRVNRGAPSSVCVFAGPNEMKSPAPSNATAETFDAVHASAVQALPSSQPPVEGAFWQPRTRSHVSTVQVTPSLHAPAIGVWTQKPPVQASFVHVFASLQSPADTQVGWHVPVEGLHACPPLQRSECWHPRSESQVSAVHASPSLQFTIPCWHPSTASQVSLVQALPSLQSRGVPGWQMPAEHPSVPLQTFPSTHSSGPLQVSQPGIEVCEQVPVPIGGMLANSQAGPLSVPV